MGESKGYLAKPAGVARASILVLHPWWGLTQPIQQVCNRLSAEGYVAFAPDLYHGKRADTIAEAEVLSNSLNDKQIEADLADAAAFLRVQTPGSPQGIGVIGFSMGAYLALELAASTLDDIQAVVLFYGTGPVAPSGSPAAYLGHFAENDPYEPAGDVQKLESALREAGRPVTFYTYPGTGHWFFEEDRPEAFHPESADLAWRRTVAFLKNTFSVPPQDARYEAFIRCKSYK